jgi:hypothetical protein
MLPDADPMVIAIHEAGHAVVARALGLKATAVTRNRVWYRLNDMGPLTRQARAVTCLSGPWAEAIYCGYSLEQCTEQWSAYWASDLRHARHYPREIGISMQHVEDLAAQYVEQHWDWIGRVAVALNTWGELRPFELEGLRRGQCARRPP